MKSLALFNNMGGAGKTTLTFHLAHLLARKGYRTVALDYDPQCHLSTLFLSDEELGHIWYRGKSSNGRTVAGCIKPVLRATRDLLEPELVPVADDLWLLPGHLDLSRFEQRFAVKWPRRRAPVTERALDVITALARLALACDAVVVPLAPDLFNVQSLANVGAALREWRDGWDELSSRRFEGRAPDSLSVHRFEPIGYIVQQHLTRARVWAEALRWAHQIPASFHRHVLAEESPPPRLTLQQDEACIASIEHVASLVPIAQLARKPIFDLKQADGLGGGQLQAVARCRKEFDGLVIRLLERLERLSAAEPARRRKTTQQ